MIVDSIKSKSKCLKSNGLWLDDKCMTKTMDTLKRLPIKKFCEVVEGNLRVPQGTFLGLGYNGVNFTLESPICEFTALHVGNERSMTEWVPFMNGKIEDGDGVRLEDTCNDCVACSKNDTNILDIESEKEAFAYQNNLKGEVLKLFMTKGGGILENEFNEFLDGSFTINCKDILGRQSKFIKETKTLTGDWEGDEKDSYDLGETETLFTNGSLDTVWKDANNVDTDEEEFKLLDNVMFRTPFDWNFLKIEETMRAARDIILEERLPGNLSLFNNYTFSEDILKIGITKAWLK